MISVCSLSIGDPLVILILTILGALCAIILILPTIPDSENSLQTRIPTYLHITTNSKVIASYVLGRRSFSFEREKRKFYFLDF